MSDIDSDDEAFPDGLQLPTPDEILIFGLKLVGWDGSRLDRRSYNKNVEQYMGL